MNTKRHIKATSLATTAQVLNMARKSTRTPVSLVERSDDELMLMTRDGLAAAFDVLVRRHQLQVLRIASKYLGCQAMAKDAAQNSFLVLYRARNTYRPESKLAAYLYRIVISQCRMLVRTARSETKRREEAQNAWPVDETWPEADILAKEEKRRVEHALGHISPKLREVVVLRFSADMSYREIADVLDLPLGTVKRRLFDGIAKLRTVMEDVR